MESYSGLKCTKLMDSSRQVMSWSRIVVFRRARRFGLLDRQRDGVRADVPEVQIGREPAGAVDFRLAVALGIVRQLVRDEVVQQLQRFARSAAKRIDRRNRAIELLPAFGDIERAIVGQRLQTARLLPFDFGFRIRSAASETPPAVACNRGRMMRAAYCSFSSSFEGTMTSASTVHSGTLSFFAASSRQ